MSNQSYFKYISDLKFIRNFGNENDESHYPYCPNFEIYIF